MIRQSLAEIAERFDPAHLAASEADVAVGELAAIESIAVALKAMAAARAAESQRWQRDGHRSAAEALASQTGSVVGAARRVLEIGRRLGDHPELSAAASRGDLSPTQVALVSEGAEANPATAPALIELATSGSLSELKERVAQIKTDACDIEQRHRRIHERRCLRHWTDTDGAWHLHATGPVEDGARIMAAIDSCRNAIFHSARAEGRREHPDAYAFDALVDVCTKAAEDSARRNATTCLSTESDPAQAPLAVHHPLDRTGDTGSRRRHRRRGPPVKILVRVDLDTWLRGFALEGEICEIAGYGQIPVSVVDDFLARDDPVVAAILTKGKQLVGVAHAGRAPTAKQQTALEWINPTCAALGCPAQAHLERDHRIDWVKTHHTIIDELDRLCRFHHKLKTHHDWALVTGYGKRAFVPPDDHRHPGHTVSQEPSQ